MKQLCIINDMDRPYSRLVVVVSEGVGRYNKLDKKLKGYKFTNFDNATPLEDFGITIVEENGVYKCTQDKESVAKYADGKQRKWQGEKEFIVL